MKKYIKEFNQEGNVILNIENVIKDWNILFHISRFKDNEREEYLLEIKEDINTTSINNISYITNQEAQILINQLNLNPVTNEKYPFYTIYKKLI